MDNKPMSITNHNKIGSYCELNNLKPVQNLKEDFDFRKPEYREEVFMRFYAFHLKYRAHAGGVYYAFQHVFDTYGFNIEQKLWFAFINGCTQNICTTLIICEKFPTLESAEPIKLQEFLDENFSKLEYDADRKWTKPYLVKTVESYKKLCGNSQEQFFKDMCYSDVYTNFGRVWTVIFSKVQYFGRLSTFSYLEYLKIVGLDIDCPTLFLEDLGGSMSHRNGIFKVYGRDDQEWHKSINPSFKGHNRSHINFAIEKGKELLDKAKIRFINEPYFKDVSYFTLETTLCCYKGWFRKNRRYPNVYNDMMYNRIRKNEKVWGDRFSVLWEARKKYLPIELRLEDNLDVDLGLHKFKQNYFRETGKVIHLDIDEDVFKNNYNKEAQELINN